MTLDELHARFQELIRQTGELTSADVRELNESLDRMVDIRRLERLASAT